MTDFSKVKSYYKKFPEWDRLDTPAGCLEFELSMNQLESQLSPGMKILDLGGGPGRYTIALAEKGYQVFLADISPKQIELAQVKIEQLEFQTRVIGTKVLSAVDLSFFEDCSFDSVVCFGPFYHLTKQDERNTAAAEIHRVLKTGGLFFCSYIPFWSGIQNLIWRAANLNSQVSIESLKEVFDTGVFENQSSDGFQEGFFYRTEELVSFFESQGFQTRDVNAVQGIGAERENDLQQIKNTDQVLYDLIKEAIIESSREQAVLEFGGHCIYTGQKI